jgi:hypothetical protein
VVRRTTDSGKEYRDDKRAEETRERLSGSDPQTHVVTVNPKAPIGRLSADATSGFDELYRIRRLLARTHLPTANLFEAETMRTVAYRLACDGIRRGVFDFSDIADLIPGDMWDYDSKPRRAQ